MVPQYTARVAVRVTLRAVGTTCRPLPARPFSTTGSTHRKHFAVLGGGLTGLATAWYLQRFMPLARVTLYEGSGRLGGWIDTETVEVKGLDGEKGTVQFERGARMVKPYGIGKWDDVAFYEMVAALNLEKQLWVRDTDPARYIYYPDHLVGLPTGADFSVQHSGVAGVASNMLKTLNMTLTEPLFEKFYPSIAKLILADLSPNRSREESIWEDNLSVGEYFSQTKLGGHREIVDNMLSAMMHGVYGGDVWKLGMASNSMFAPVFRGIRFRAEYLKERDMQDPGNQMQAVPVADSHLLEELERTGQDGLKVMAACGKKKALGFRNGFKTMVDAIVRDLERNPLVRIDMTKVTGVKLTENGKMEITRTPKDKTLPPTVLHDKVVSSLNASTLATLTPRNSIPSLSHTPAVTIRLINLWSPHPNLNYPTHGFGYLLPQTVPFSQNPHAALGVIFDSDAKPPPYSLTTPSYGDTIPGTKVTVMLGGHHWSGLPESFLPDDETAIVQAKETIRIQLGIPTEAWTVASTKLARDCIPQQLVGHTHRMQQADWELSSAFDGKLAVVGGSYTAPGVPGSLRAARDVAAQAAGRFKVKGKEKHEGSESVGDTGLARFKGDPRNRWTVVDRGWLERFRGVGV